ncbi:hypothetical protein [uncultured Alistipes sp.]|uniref:hypothetical protein n=1 Tax=uncultured Alistipes sp. TaxID=538949 RepID=UPI002621A73A|nr:hypothetical protein [uncultured Alistipes sp.]
MKRIVLLLALFSICRPGRTAPTFFDMVQTSDKLYWNGEEYDMIFTPLVVFDGYKKIFSDFERRMKEKYPKKELSSHYPAMGTPFIKDKNYSIVWKIVGDRLYINRIHFDPMFSIDENRKYTDEIYPGHEHYKRLEKMTGEKFSQTASAVEAEPVTEYGVMPATWVDGDILIQRASDAWDEEALRHENAEHPAWRITLKNGRIVARKKIADVTVIDAVPKFTERERTRNEGSPDDPRVSESKCRPSVPVR